jgi:alkanesulfonate monooxygenase SsuD/methylene tetrahydromethanopterin reductase-like flavin-dependent oxidoreductase (luciferase family)
MTSARRLRFGIKTSPQLVRYDDLLPLWLEADQAHPLLEHAWINDHLVPPQTENGVGPALESWTLLAALAARTERLRLGVMVSGNTVRPPALLAKMAATVDQIAHGRLDFGLGAGWHPGEHAMYHLPLPHPPERIARLDESCELIRRLWTEDVVTFAGAYYQLTAARCDPKPVTHPHPPFLIGGEGEHRTLRVVARHADIWNMEVRPTEMFTHEPVERFVHKNARLNEHCVAVGRDPAAIERSVQLFADSETLGGTRAMLEAFVTAGVSHIVLILRPPYAPDILSRLVDEIVRPLRAPCSEQH